MKQRSRGFSLMELMVAIAVFGILMGLGVPAFRDLVRNNGATAAQNDLVTALATARSEALRRNRPVSVCASADGVDCSGDEADWKTGWIAITDRGTPGSLDGDDLMLQSWIPNATLDITTDGGDSFVQYLPTGLSAAAVTLDIAWEACTGKHKRRVTIVQTGSVSGQLVDCAD